MRRNDITVQESFFPIGDFFKKEYTFWDIEENPYRLELSKPLTLNPNKPNERMMLWENHGLCETRLEH